MSTKSILTKSSITLEQYLNNASPTGFEAEGQKLWMEYLKPYVDTFITDTYGTSEDFHKWYPYSRHIEIHGR
jgi:hypothetical protein